LLQPILVFLFAVLLLLLTWGRWVEPFIDFGRELYLAWRISEGDVLYRDLASFFGPLAPHVNGLLFRVFGPGIHVLVTANIFVLALFTGLSFRILARLSDSRSAAGACMAFLALCGFGYYATGASYNFLAPYSHDLTHGLLISAIGLAFLEAGADGRRFAVLAVGLCAGLTILTKPEIALASNAALGIGFLLSAYRPDSNAKSRRLEIILFGSGFLAPVLLYVSSAWVSGRESPWTGIVWPWAATLNGEVLDLLFYQMGFGVDHPIANLRWIVGWTLAWVVLIAGPLWVAGRLPPHLQKRSTLGLWSFGSVLPLGLLSVLLGDWFRAFSPLLPLLLLMLGLHLRTGPTAAREGRWSRWVLATSALVFSILLLGKMGLRPQLRWYGFALAAPALMAVTAWLLGPVPSWVDRRYGLGRVIRGSTSALLLAVGIVHMSASYIHYSQKTFPVGKGRDRILVDPERGMAMAAALVTLTAPPNRGGTLLVVPEGISLNYLSRRQDPVSVMNFLPPELILFGEDRIVSGLSRNPPESIIIVPKLDRVFGGEFGEAFGRWISAWIGQGYVEVDSFPGGMLRGAPFVLKLLEPHATLGKGVDSDTPPSNVSGSGST